MKKLTYEEALNTIIELQNKVLLQKRLLDFTNVLNISKDEVDKALERFNYESEKSSKKRLKHAPVVKRIIISSDILNELHNPYLLNDNGEIEFSFTDYDDNKKSKTIKFKIID